MSPSNPDSGGETGQPEPPRPPTGTVVVGRYILEIGAPAGTAIRDAEGEERDNVPSLQRALKKDKPGAQEPAGAAPTDAAAAVVDEASEVTSKAERAVSLFTELAEGRGLEPEALSGEIPALLDLLERLDGEGRWSEALRMARALSGLLALMMRWVELVRSLQVALRAAEKLGDLRAIGWAVHELGTLHLGAEKASAAERRLGQARDIRQRLGDREGLAITEHNLQALCRLMRQLLREHRLLERNTGLQRLRHSPALAIALAAALLAGGAVAGAAIQGSGGPALPNSSTANQAGQSSKPDLVVSVDKTQQVGDGGSPACEVAYTLTNKGGSRATASTTALRLSAAAFLTHDSQPLDEGVSRPETETAPQTDCPSTQDVTATADAEDQVVEANEDNKVGPSPVPPTSTSTTTTPPSTTTTPPSTTTTAPSNPIP